MHLRTVLASASWALLAVCMTAQAARVSSVSPLGLVEGAEVRQVVVRFDQPVVAAGDPRLPAPFTLSCQGQAAPGEARWDNPRTWIVDLQQPLAAGVRCTLNAAPAFQPLGGGTLEGPREYGFATGAPVVLQVQPFEGSRIEEDQHFLLRLNGAVLPASVARAAWCEAEGVNERIAVTVVEGAARRDLLRQRRFSGNGAEPDKLLLLACQRSFAPEARVRLLWGPGIAAAAQPQLVSKRTQRFEWRVRPRFLAEFSCERENAQAPCLALRPLSLRFNAPVPRALALGVRLVPEKGQPIAPRIDGSEDRSDHLSSLRFAAPLPENMRFRIVLPPALVDDGGRALANAGSFPLAVATGGLPPLAKFAGAPFGIVEYASDAAEPALMPLTLRHVQADLAGASTGGTVRSKRFDSSTADAELLRWLARLRKDNDDQFKTREHSLLTSEQNVQRASLPQLQGAAQPAATEVIGIPLRQRGYHIVEVESRVLGNSLLAARAPMFARTGALVTNLAVHFKRGRSSSLVWVTTLDRGRPVPGARVVVNDCNGKPLWNGSTETTGIARIARGFDTADVDGDKCLSREGLFVTARLGDDVSFVFSEWNRGIEPWRFNIPLADGQSAGRSAAEPDRRAHTVFDRTLLRAGELVSMKHFIRDEVQTGLALPVAASLPTEVLLRHVGSDTEVRLPLAWPSGARSAQSSWQIPKNAALGLVDVTLVAGDRRWPSGSFRVEAFRVPLVDARLAAPAGLQVAPAEVAFAAQINALAGGPMPDAPLQLSALLRRAAVQFAGYEEFSFEPPGRGRGGEEDEGDGSRLVADKLAASTDKQGAARIVAKGLPPITTPSDLLAELSFNDPNGEVQTVSTRVRLWPSALVIGLRVPGWAAVSTQDGAEAGLTAVLLSTDGKPLGGRAVEVFGRAHQTMSTRKRIVGGFYAYDNQRQTRELGSLCKGTTDASGRLSCSLKLQASGEVELIARARDDAGRVTEAASTLWVSAQEQWWFAQDNDDRIDVLPEQREVMPGQTARLQVRMPFAQATALVTVEREGVIDSRVVLLSGKQPVIELPIPRSAAGTPSWAPNVIVSVLVQRGRLREAPWWSLFTWGWREPGDWWRAFRYEGRDYRAPTGLVDLAKPAFKLGVAQLNVGTAEHKIDVRVATDKPQYGVRETIKATVRVSHGGKPLAGAQIAFVAVDEGLLALQPNTSWDLLEGLLRPRPWGVATATALNEVVGRRHYGRKALPPGGGGGRNPTRELFDTLLLWRASVQLDDQGQAQIDVPLNDSLTSFRLVAIADAGVDKFGSGSTSVRVSQDLQMLSGLPPLAREGDRFEAGFTLRNTTARSMTVKATLRGMGTNPGAGSGVGSDTGTGTGTGTGTPGKAVETSAQTLTLAPGAASEVRWPVQVPQGLSRIDWQAAVEETGTGNPARDRLGIVQAVLPAVPERVWSSSLLQIDASASFPLAAPADALPGSARVLATLQPKLSGALPGLRRWFERYPYSCLEQKTSRAIGLRDAAAWALLRDELAAYIDSDGLAGYFVAQPGSAARGSDRLSAYLLTVAHEAGWSWPDAARDKLLQGLAAFVEGRIERRFAAPRADLDVRKLAALEALSRHGRVQPRMLGSIGWQPAAWPTSALLDGLSLYQRSMNLPERTARLDELQRLLRSRLVLGGTALRFSTEAQDDWWWLMDGPDANAARLLLLAVDMPAWQEDLPLILSGTLGRQRGGAWLTTTANLWGVLALERFGARFESSAVAGRSTLQLAAASRTHDWSAQAGGGSFSLPLTDKATATLTAAHQGPGKPWLTLQSLAAVPLQAALASGFRITRSVAAVQRKQAGSWSRGDIVRVRIDIDAAADMGWVVISDPLPAGAAVLGGGLARDSTIAAQAPTRDARVWPAYQERALDAFRSYYEWLPRGKHTLEYTLRLNTAGRFALPPTRVEAMYAPETFGELPNSAIEVQP